MIKLFLLSLITISTVYAACRNPSSIYNPNKVKCSTCGFLQASKAFQGSGTQYSVICPGNYDLWFYNEYGKEFVAPMSAIAGRATLRCDGSTWKITIPGQSQRISAFACAES